MLDLSKCPPSRLAKLVTPQWRFEPHLQEVEQLVLDTYRSEVQNNIICQLPIGFGKTTYLCKLLAFDLLCHNPDENIILASYSSDFAAESVATVRDWVDAYGPAINRISVDPSWSSKGYFKVKGRNGSMRAVSVGSRFGGADAHSILVDDIFSDPQDALSPTVREGVELWWSGQLMGRKRSNKVHQPKTIVLGTPKHPEEISMKLEASNPDLPPEERWHVYRMPAIRQDGTALSPRFPLDKLMQIKARYEALGQSHLWSTLYMCDPQLSQYLSFLSDWLPAFEQKPKLEHIHLWYDATLRPWVYAHTLLKLVACDASISGYGDYTAILTVHIVRHDDGSLHLYVDKHFRKQCAIPEARSALTGIILRDKPDACSCESNGFQRIIANDVSDEIAQRGFLGKIRPFEPPKGRQPKDDIAIRLSDILADGRLHLFHSNENVQLRAELAAFPHGAHDDSADALRQIVHLANELLFTSAT